jgi:hypothetical protein
MHICSAAQIAEKLPYEVLIAGLRDAFTQNIQAPARSMYSIDDTPGPRATLGLMAAWCVGEESGD